MSFTLRLVRLIWLFLRFLPVWFRKRLFEVVHRTVPFCESTRTAKVAEPRSIVYRVDLNSGRYSWVDPHSVSSI